MPGGFEDDVTARAAMAARDLTHREEMKEGKRGMRDGETACSSHVGSREERDPRRRRWASHGGARVTAGPGALPPQGLGVHTTGMYNTSFTQTRTPK